MLANDLYMSSTCTTTCVYILGFNYFLLANPCYKPFNLIMLVDRCNNISRESDRCFRFDAYLFALFLNKSEMGTYN